MARRARQTDEPHRRIRPLLRPTGPVQSWLFLTVSLAGYAALNAFWHYLATGRWVDFSLGAYRRCLASPLTELGSRFIYPLNLLNHPWMVLVMGLLLAAVVFVPVILAVLHRLVLTGLFVAAVAVLGHAPVLALALAIACFLAARTPLRIDMPFLAFLLGLVPVGAYLYLLGLAGTSSPAVQPLQRWILVAPSAMALMLAVSAAVVVLALARLGRYRPFVVLPALVVLLAAPFAVFVLKTGPDALELALLRAQTAGDGLIFQPMDLRTWRAANAQGISEDRLLNRLQDDLQARQRHLCRQCEEFILRHPTSPGVPAVLWIQGQCLDQEVSVPALAAGRIAYVASRVQVASEPVWRRLAERHAGTVQAAVAEWRLAELALRVGKPAEADGRLRKAADALRQSLAEEDRRRAARERVDDVFVDASPLPSARYQEEALFGVEELLWLMRRNSVLTDPRCAEALASLLDVDEQALTAEEYYRRLSELAGRYEDTALAENIKLAVARATKDPKERLEQLLLLARQQADPDAAVEADFELGRLALWEAMRRLCPDLATPRAYFQRVADGPSSPWQPSARERLAWLEATSRPAG